MKITIVQGPFLPVPTLRGGAVEKMWFELGKQFSSKGHSVIHISRIFDSLPARQVISNVLHIRVRGFDWPTNILVLKFLDFIYTLNVLRVLPSADILITNTFWLPLILSLRKHRFGKIVVDVQRIPKGQMFLYSLVPSLRANSTSVFNAIFAQAPYLKNKIFTIPNPLPYLPSAASVYTKQKVMLYAGRLHPEKGIWLLVSAFIIAYEMGLRGWSLHLVGGAESSAGGGGKEWFHRVESYAETSKLPIRFLGPVYNDPDLQKHYQDSSIFVYPSLADRGESFGMAPLEAMAFGTVPIVSSVACFSDFITHDHNGLIFDHHASNASELLAQCMILLATTPDKLASMSKASLGVVDTHHPAVIADGFLTHFNSILD